MKPSEQLDTSEGGKIEIGKVRMELPVIHGMHSVVEALRETIDASGPLNKLEHAPNQLNGKELAALLSLADGDFKIRAFSMAKDRRETLYGRDVFIRAVIDISNYCRKLCTFCGNAATSKSIPRFRASNDEIINQARVAAEMGIDLIHLASGEDIGFGMENLLEVVAAITKLGCTVELALGEREVKDYEALYAAGARRAIIKFETSSKKIFSEVKPREDLSKRIQLIRQLKETGYAVGTGNIIGLPGQNIEDVAQDLLLALSLDTSMSSTSVFVPNQESQLRSQNRGNENIGLMYITLLRLLSGTKRISIPTNSTLGHAGKYQALDLGAVELSLNLTPETNQDRYSLYEGRSRHKADKQELAGKVSGLSFNLVPFSEFRFEK